MGCVCVRPPKSDSNGAGPSQPEDPHASTDPESVVLRSGNKPPPPAVPPKKREW